MARRLDSARVHLIHMENIMARLTKRYLLCVLISLLSLCMVPVEGSKEAPVKMGKMVSVEGSCLVPPDRAKLLQANGYPTKTPKQIIKAANSESYFVRFIALELLTKRIKERAIPTLKKALNDLEPRVRWTAAHLLGTLNDKSGLEQMKKDLKELAPNNGAFLPSDPNLPKEEIREREAKWKYRLVDALEVAKVLAELGDYSGYELGTRMAIEGTLHAQRWKAVSVLIEMAKINKAELQAKGIDPVCVLKASAQSEKSEGVFQIILNLAQRELKKDVALEILEIAKGNQNQAEMGLKIAQMHIDAVKAR